MKRVPAVILYFSIFFAFQPFLCTVQAQTPNNVPQTPGVSQTPNNVPQAPYLKNPGILPFKILQVDSTHFYTKDDIKKNRKVLIIFFSPDCEHCKHQTKDILADFDKFKDIEIVMATFQPFEEMKSFYYYFKIGDHPNILMGRDEKYMFQPFYNFRSLPFLALYDKKGQYITRFEGNQKVETILNAFAK
jgi:thioredoxin-related protein